MTVKELWKHVVTPPFNLTLKSDEGIIETTYSKHRTLELVEQYADRRVKDWCVGYSDPFFFLQIWVESEYA